MRTFIIYLLTTVVALGQETKTQQFEILGIGKIQATADHIIAKITLGGLGNDYNKIVKETNDQTEAIRKTLLKLGLKEHQIVISDFMTRDNAQFRDYDQDTANKRFEVVRHVNVKYTFDKDLNSRVIYSLATNEIKPHFKFEFGLSDAKKNILRDELIRKALDDAKNKADLIAGKYGLKLKRILKVKYGNTTIDPDLRGNSVDLVGESLQPYYTETKEDSPEFDYMETVLVIWEFES